MKTKSQWCTDTDASIGIKPILVVLGYYWYGWNHSVPADIMYACVIWLRLKIAANEVC